ncbi:MAG TPA: hypothetical protein VMT15_00720 [Bryobacteraceae bacterium]|nr:hypothetical protein [Bryobacteraceae bacterium]
MLCDTPFQLAVIDAEPSTVTDPTVAMKPAELCPAPMVTDAGTVTLELLLDSPTLTAPVAADDSVTVQVEVPGAVTVVGEQEMPLSCTTGVRLMEVETVVPFQLALTFAVELDDSVPAVARKVADGCPAAMVTLGGTVSEALSLFSEIVAALEAALLRDTVQVAEAPLDRVDGLHETDVNCAGAV